MLAETCEDRGHEGLVGVPAVGVGDRDPAAEARLLARDEREPGEQVRGAERRRIAAGEEVLESRVGGDHGDRSRVVAGDRLHLVRMCRRVLLDFRGQRGSVDDELTDAGVLKQSQRPDVERSGERGARIDVDAEEGLEGGDTARQLRVGDADQPVVDDRRQVERHERSGEDLVARRGLLEQRTAHRDVGQLGAEARPGVDGLRAGRKGERHVGVSGDLRSLTTESARGLEVVERGRIDEARDVGGVGPQRPHPRDVQRSTDREAVTIGGEFGDHDMGDEVRDRFVARAPEVDLQRVHAAGGQRGRREGEQAVAGGGVAGQRVERDLRELP